MIIIPDEGDKKICEDMCNQVIDLISQIKRTDLRIFVMRMLIESFEASHDCKLYINKEVKSNV